MIPEEYIELLKEHREEICELAKEVFLQFNNYQTDIYLYPDGTVKEFVNVGGNSWSSAEHITVIEIKESKYSMAEKEEMRENEKETYEYMSDLVDVKIETLRYLAKNSLFHSTDFQTLRIFANSEPCEF